MDQLKVVFLQPQQDCMRACPPCGQDAAKAARATKNRSRAYALCAVLSPPQFGQGSMLRIALLPAQTVSNLERYMPYPNYCIKAYLTKLLETCPYGLFIYAGEHNTQKIHLRRML